MDREYYKPKPKNMKKELTEEHAKKLNEQKRESERRALKTYYGGSNPLD